MFSIQARIMLVVFSAAITGVLVAEPPSSVLPTLSERERKEGSRCFAATVLCQHESGLAIRSKFIDVRSERSVIFIFDENQEPAVQCAIDGSLFWKNEDALEMIEARLAQKLENGLVKLGMHGTSNPTCPPEDDFSLPIRRLLNSEPVFAREADAASYSTLVHRRKGTVRVWKRPPSERKLLGHPLRAGVVTLPDTRVQMLFFNIQTGDGDFGRADHDRWASASTKLSSLVSSATPNAEADSLEAFKSACAEAFERSYPGAATRKAQIHKLVDNNLPEKTKQFTKKEATRARLQAAAVMSEISKDLDKLLQCQGSIAFDPFLRGVVLEQALWDRQAVNLPVNALMLAIMGGLRGPQGITGADNELQYSLMCKYADLGFSPNQYSYMVLAKCLNGDYEDHIAASVLARWRRPTKPRHAQAVLDFIEWTPLPIERVDAIETAIIMGRFEDVSEPDRELWFELRIEPDDEGQRMRSLCYAAMHADSRSYLLAKWEELDEESEIRSAIRDLLLVEVSATEEFEQYDYIAQEECQAIKRQLMR